jgi:non-heme chloroperoxidase
MQTHKLHNAAAATISPAGRLNSNTFTTKDGAVIYFKDWGAGPAVLFSHGYPLSSDAWESQMMFLLQHGYRVVAHDRRGFGRSSQPSQGYDFDTFADDLAALVEALGLVDVTFVGHSMGAARWPAMSDVTAKRACPSLHSSAPSRRSY